MRPAVQASRGLPDEPEARSSCRGEARARLKHETAELHAWVEGRMALPRRLASEESYRALLERFIGFVMPIEVELARFAWPDDLAFPARRKADLLGRDLLLLGHTPASLLHLTRFAAVPALPTLAAAFGCLYVLEGSTLGGRIILRRVRASLGREAGSGVAYFEGYGSRTGAMWSSFLATLAREVTERRAIDEAVQGAATTFEALGRWLDPDSVTTPAP